MKGFILSIFHLYCLSLQVGKNHHPYLRSCHGNKLVLFCHVHGIFLRHSLSLKSLNSSETDIKPQRTEKWGSYFFSPPSLSFLQRQDRRQIGGSWVLPKMIHFASRHKLTAGGWGRRWIQAVQHRQGKASSFLDTGALPCWLGWKPVTRQETQETMGNCPSSHTEQGSGDG